MRIEKELLDIKNDYVFKRVFGHVGNEKITAELLSSILKKKVSNVVLDKTPILEKDLIDDKVGVLDIYAEIDGSIRTDIEMQMGNRDNIEKRMLFYWSKIYERGIKKGEHYDELKKSIVILISNYELDNLKKIEKYLTKWNIREEEYQKVILTDALEFYILELPKYEKYKKRGHNKLDIWVEFMKNSGGVNMEKATEGVKEAKKVLEEISQDDHEWYLAHLREKYILDMNDCEYTGYKKGVKKGERNKQISIAKKMKEENVDIKTISKFTGLTVKEIEKLK